MLRVFSAAGVESHYQQLKNLLRWKFESVSYNWRIPRRREHPIFLKETLGPYTHAESVFNPLAILLGAGYPPEKLRLLIYGRAPRQTWLSWRECWRGRTAVEHLAAAYQRTEAIRQQARSLEIPVTTAVYEALRDHEAGLVVQRMFSSLALRVDQEVIANAVSNLPALTGDNRSVVFPSEPAAFDSWPFLGRAQESRRLSYFRREDEPLNQHEVASMLSGRVVDIYDTWRRQCEDDLQLAVERDADFDGEVASHLAVGKS